MSKSEAAVQQEIRVAAAENGIWLMRNNSGACYDDTGRLIRYGLGNDSAQLNKRIKSGDLIGSRPLLITQEMVGYMIGVFTSIEVKAEGWRHEKTFNDREMAQLEFGNMVHLNHGYAGFAASVDDFKKVVGL